MHILKTAARWFGKTVKWFFIVFFVYLLSLVFREERIPGRWVERAVAAHLPTNMVFRCGDVDFGLRRIAVHGFEVRDLSRHDPSEPLFSAELAEAAVFSRRLTVVGARMARLHDAYYEEGPYAEPLGDGPIAFGFPSLPQFMLVLERPAILGVEPARVEAVVVSRSECLDFRSIRLDWPSRGRKMSIDGSCRVDLASRRVSGEVRGLATQAFIRPLIVALDLPAALEYIDAFTGVTEPVPASCTWNVNLVDNDFKLGLELHPTLGFYRGVPMRRADGGITIHTTFPVRDGVRRMDYKIGAGPLTASDVEGRPLSGSIAVRGVDDAIHLDLDADSSLEKADVLNIIDYLNDGVLDCLVCDDAPLVKIRGTLAVDAEHQADNNLYGSIAFSRGSLFGIRLADASVGFAYVGEHLTFFDAETRGRDGGVVRGTARLSFPRLDAARATFSIDANYRDGSVGEMADMLGVDFGDREGVVEGEIGLSGPIATNVAECVKGGGYLKVTNGRLARMKLFMGLTDLLANEVPGVDKVVDQSEASATFTIEKGVVRSRDILIEGALFSISARGEYDIANDSLDFVVRVELMRKDSILGKYLIRPVLWPFTKLLLEFKVAGSLDDPKWEYISVLDRIM